MKYKYGQFVHKKTDTEAVMYQITAILRRGTFVQYELSNSTGADNICCYVQEIEIEPVKEIKKVKGFSKN